MTSLALVLFASALCKQVAASCYWNAECPFLLHSTKTPYDTVRGDIRDYAVPQSGRPLSKRYDKMTALSVTVFWCEGKGGSSFQVNEGSYSQGLVRTDCEAVSIWTLNRHGNRNPGKSVTESIKYIASLKDVIIESYEAGRGQLCAQDVENFRKWTWNGTLEVSQSFLTSTGYEELFEIAKRIREKYPHLLQGRDSDYYFRPTNEQRTITSAIAFVHGLTEGTNLTVTPDDVRARDDVIRPYENCDLYQETVKSSQMLDDQMEAYYKTAEFIAVHNAVQQRLGLNTTLTADEIYAFYEICRFDRSWTEVHQSPWCAAFSNEDLVVLEYRDDVRHYYRNGYGSWVNVNLGGPALKDLYENFEASVNGQGKKVVSYFTHDTMLEMVYCAMGIFKDADIQASNRDPNRLWRTSSIGSFSVNIIAVLNSCEEFGSQSYRVQLFVNEKETELCPIEGCTWQQFQDMFQGFKSADLEFCNMEYYRLPESDGNNAV